MLTGNLEWAALALVAKLYQTWNNGLNAVLEEEVALFHDEICVSRYDVLSVSWWSWTIFDLVSLWLEDHKKNAWLNVVAGFYKSLWAIANHEGCKEDMNSPRDRNWYHLVLGIVSVEVQARENLKEEVLQQLLWEDANSLEKCRSNLEGNALHPDLCA